MKGSSTWIVGNVLGAMRCVGPSGRCTGAPRPAWPRPLSGRAAVSGHHRPVCSVVVWLLFSAAGVPFAAAQEGADATPTVTVAVEVTGSVTVPPAPRLTLAAWRVTVPPGTSLRAVTLPGPILIAVEAGELIVGGPRRQWADGSSRLLAGEVATLGPGARIRPRTDGEVTAAFLFVSLFPAESTEERPSAALGGAASPTEEDA